MPHLPSRYPIEYSALARAVIRQGSDWRVRTSSFRRHARLLQFPPEPPRDPAQEHAEVADQRPERIGECGGSVLLDEEMGDPSKEITGNERGKDPAIVLEQD